MSEEYKTYAYFWVSGFDCSHDVISGRLGLTPTEAWNKGDKGKYIPKQKESYWMIYSPLPKDEIFIDSHIKALLKILMQKSNEIQELKKQFSVGVNCVGYYQCVNPGFHMSEEIINNLATLGLSVDFDLYCLDESNQNAV